MDVYSRMVAGGCLEGMDTSFASGALEQAAWSTGEQWGAASRGFVQHSDHGPAVRGYTQRLAQEEDRGVHRAKADCPMVTRPPKHSTCRTGAGPSGPAPGRPQMRARSRKQWAEWVAWYTTTRPTGIPDVITAAPSKPSTFQHHDQPTISRATTEPPTNPERSTATDARSPSAHPPDQSVPALHRRQPRR